MIEDKIESLIADRMISGELDDGNIAEISQDKADPEKLILKVANG